MPFSASAFERSIITTSWGEVTDKQTETEY